jgi:signal transduction histidine kinase
MMLPTPETRAFMDAPVEIPTRLRLRLMVALPALLSLFMLVVGMFFLFFFTGLFVPTEMATGSFEKPIALSMLLMTALAFSGNLVAGIIISRHLKGFMLTVEKLMRPDSAAPKEIEASSEIGALRIMLDEASVTLSRFIHDSYIVDNLPEAVITVDAEGKILAINPNASKLLAVDPQQSIGKKLREFIPGNHAGRAFYGLVDEGLKGKYNPLQVVSFRLANRESKDYWVSVNPLRKGSYLPNAISIVIKDQASIVAIRNQIQKLERLAAVGRVASSIAHEVRNPLGAIRTFTELIQEDLPPDDPRATYVNEILSQIERLNRLIEDVLSFSRDSVISIEDVDIKELLSKTASLAKHKFLNKLVVVNENYKPGLPTIWGDEEKLSQAFLNILINCFEACGDRGWISISADFEMNADETGKIISITIVDSGKGIPPEQLNKIFEPFFTTKSTGTGIGLASTYHIITAHGGNIEVYSQPGKGTTFSILLPEKHHFLESDEDSDWSHSENG